MDRIAPHIFLLDGLGALLSTSATAFVLPAVQPWIGLPREVLIGLATPAALFAAYSLSCWLLLSPSRVTPWLAGIVFANLAYCSVVVLTLAWFVQDVTPLGLAYFVGEIAIIVGIVALESRVARAA